MSLFIVSLSCVRVFVGSLDRYVLSTKNRIKVFVNVVETVPTESKVFYFY